VGNLPQVYDKDMLRQLFSHLGNVIHSAVITEQGTGVSRGFGFVHFPDAATVGAGGQPRGVRGEGQMQLGMR
jgi:RNA recognition motif-containing protein